jgi:hypothetical protein
MGRSRAPAWAIIYDGLDVISSDDCSWEEADANGVLAIVFRSVETGWSIAQPGDYYVRLEENEFLPVGYDAVIDYICNVFEQAGVYNTGFPTIFVLNSGKLVDKDGLILHALEEGLMKRGRMVTRTMWAEATGLALQIMGNVKKTGRFKWEEVQDGLI